MDEISLCEHETDHAALGLGGGRVFVVIEMKLTDNVKNISSSLPITQENVTVLLWVSDSGRN